MAESLAANIAIFLAAAAVIGVAGVALTRDADRLADRTGLGEAIFGAVFLGICTSLAGTITSVTAALDGAAQLAFSNAVGGIAAQTFFLAIADVAYRRANLEHAAASQTNLFQAGQLLLLLSLPLGAALLPEATLWRVHPVTPLLLVFYIVGLRLARDTESAAMWRPRDTAETREDQPDQDDEEEEEAAEATWRLALRFALLAAIVSVAGYAIAKSGQVIASESGLSQTFVGFLFTAVATSLPELVTTVAAVRRGALTLAVGGIIGGNTFDVLFLVASDVAYQPGSLYHAVGQRELFLVVWAMAMTAVLLLGLIKREEKGPGKIGFESLGLVLLYAAGVAIQARLG